MGRALAIFILFSVVLPIGYSARPRESAATGVLDGELPSIADTLPDTDDDSFNRLAAEQRRTLQKTESKVTIIFAGLIYFRHKDGLYKACVLRGIPNHTFRLYTSGIAGEVDTSSFLKEGTEWNLQVIQSSGNTQEGVHPRLIGATFDPKDYKHRADDYRWMLDFDVLHPGYKVDESGLLPVIRIHGGELFTLCRTIPLNHTRGGNDSGEFGAMADITGVDITLNEGDKLTLRTSDGNDIIHPIQYQPGTTQYIGFLNLPSNEELRRHSAMLRKQVRMAGRSNRDVSTHFENYYLLIYEPYSERYDFQLRGTPVRCPSLPEINWLVTKTMSPPPYYCGTGGGTK